MVRNVNDAAALAFVEGQAYRINTTIYEERFPDWDFGRLVFVDTAGPEWAPGTLTYTSGITGEAQWQSAYAKDVPLADVNQDMQMTPVHLAAIGYQYNMQEINTIMAVPGMALDARRARSARIAYQKFMWNTVMRGDARKGFNGLINYPGVTATAAANNGTGGVRWWISNAGVVTKTPENILADVNLALSGVPNATNMIEYADTLLLPPRAYQVLAATPLNALASETVLTWLLRTNIYTLTTGRLLTVLADRELNTASTQTVVGGGRMVAYKNDPAYVKVDLPMPHRFLPVYQDGPFNFQVPGIFRTGGLQIMSTSLFNYVDGIIEPPA